MEPSIERARRWSVWPLVCAAIGVAFSGCRRDETTDPDASVDCHDYASAFCARYAACNPVAVREDYSDVETCTARWTLDCLANAGSGWSSDKIEQCTEQIKASTSCYQDWLFTNACELAPGALPTGAPCDVNAQCATLNCEFAYGSYPDGGASLPVCGTCAPRSGTPGCGSDGACQPPQRCVRDRNNVLHCITPQPEGAPCVSAYGCEDGLFCQGAPSGAGTWVCSKRGAAGVACTDHAGCDIKAGLRCVAGVCDVPTFVANGASCDSNGRLCENGLCLSPVPILFPPTSPENYTCQAYLDDGSPCEVAVSYDCRFPAMCRDGQCRLPGDPQCRAY
jgi:hypothetical protein